MTRILHNRLPGRDSDAIQATEKPIREIRAIRGKIELTGRVCIHGNAHLT